MAGEKQPCRKTPFAPIASRSRKPMAAVPKVNEDEGDQEAAQEDQTWQSPKADTESSTQVEYGPGDKTEPSRTFDASSTPAGNEQMIESEPSIANKEGYKETCDVAPPRNPTEYGVDRYCLISFFCKHVIIGPSEIENAVNWCGSKYDGQFEASSIIQEDQTLQSPNADTESKEFELLKNLRSSDDEEEFVEDATYDENTLNAASELGLQQEKQDKRRMFLLRFPPLPFLKQSGSSKGKEKVGYFPVQVEDFPAGYMGKMLVYKSGAVKLKIGEMVFYVTPSNCSLAQAVVIMNIQEKQCCNLGQVEKCAVIGIDWILSPILLP